MNAAQREVQAELQEIYERLPKVECHGKCFGSCSFIGTFGAERDRMRGKGITPPGIAEAPCRHLTVLNLCGIHDDRPLICRLYGVSAELRCPWGCRPERELTSEESRELMHLVDQLRPVARGRI
jgi:Fe-S-cluster containining protein